MPTLDLTVVWNFTTAILIGALLGIERERHKHEHGDASIGGLRTFMLFALIGALGGWLSQVLASPWILVATILAAMAPAVGGYLLSSRSSASAVGITTQLAGLATCLLGALTALGQRELAVGIGVMVAAILAYKQPLHGIALRLDREDVYAGLRLLIATFIVLPLLPDRPIDPWGALNPRSLWMLVLLISVLSLVGYVATRLLGSKRGIPLTGLSGGLVSSTAVTLAFSRQSREKGYEQSAAVLAGGMLLSWAVMFARILVEVLVVNPALLKAVLVPFSAMGAATLALAWYFHRRGEGGTSLDAIRLVNPFSLTAAARFASFFALVLLVVQLVRTYAPESGVYVVAALAGTTDVDAITLSMAQVARDGNAGLAVHAITIAALTNSAVKTGMVIALGSPPLRRSIVKASAVILAAGASTLLVG